MEYKELNTTFLQAIKEMPLNRDVDVITVLAGSFGVCILIYQLFMFTKWAYSMALVRFRAHKSMIGGKK